MLFCFSWRLSYRHEQRFVNIPEKSKLEGRRQEFRQRFRWRALNGYCCLISFIFSKWVSCKCVTHRPTTHFYAFFAQRAKKMFGHVARTGEGRNADISLVRERRDTEVWRAKLLGKLCEEINSRELRRGPFVTNFRVWNNMTRSCTYGVLLGHTTRGSHTK